MASAEASDGTLARRSRIAPVADDITHISMPPAVTIVGVTAILYLGRDVLLPIAIALLLTFALAPIVSFLRRRGVPKAVAIIATVALAFAAIALFAFMLASQVNTLAQNIPSYQYNIIEKVRSLKELGGEGGVIDHISDAVSRVGKELSEGTQAAKEAAPAEPEPMPVRVVPDQNALDILQNIVVPLISPFATAGLIVVVVIFMLFEREALRDRFIRLVGSSDLHRTTEALQDAGRRVGRYLLMQLVINTTYAIPIALGLWLLGIPNALLWGLLTLVLRFVPYIGPAIGMLLPMLVTLAVTPGWAPLLWTAALFLVMELISNNVMEPWLYGSRTGLSPLAIIVAAIFWAWLWGPLGLVLSTPLTVCLVVLGRHVPQFQYLDVLLGNEPVLEPHARVYQRLLAGDPDEAADYAEEFLEEKYLVEFYDQVGIPALMLAERDRERGVMADEGRDKLAASVEALVADLNDVAEEEEEENGGDDEGDSESATSSDDATGVDLPDGDGRSLLCIGGRGSLDDAAAAMLAQVLEVQGAAVQRAPATMLESGKLGALPLEGVDTVVLTFLNSQSGTHARYAVRRLKRLDPNIRVGLFMPSGAFSERSGDELSAEQISADFITATLADTVVRGFADEKPVRLKTTSKRLSARRKTTGKSATKARQAEPA